MNVTLRNLTAGLIALGGLGVAAQSAIADVYFLGVDKKATLINDDSSVVVTGTVTCTLGDTVSVGAVVSQKAKQQNSVLGSGYSDDLPCTGQPMPYITQVDASVTIIATYKKGPAQSYIDASSTDGMGNYDDQVITAVIHLRN